MEKVLLGVCLFSCVLSFDITATLYGIKWNCYVDVAELLTVLYAGKCAHVYWPLEYLKPSIADIRL